MNFKTNFVFLVVIILSFLFVFNSNIYDILPRKSKVCECEKIENCFFNNIISMEKLVKPKIFIHVEDENNILGITQICIESVMKYCSSKFDIVLYTNNDVQKMIDEDEDELCNIKNIELLGGQDLKQWEEYCKFKIVHKYGGVVMKPHFLFSSCPEYKEFVPDKLKVCRINNEGVNISNRLIVPSSCYMIAAPKNDEMTKVYLDYLRKKCQNDYTSDSKYFNKTFEKLNYLNYFSEESIGVVDSNNKPIYLETIFTTQPIKFATNNYCLFINVDLLYKKRHQGWILNMSNNQLLDTNTVFSNYAKLSY